MPLDTIIWTQHVLQKNAQRCFEL